MFEQQSYLPPGTLVGGRYKIGKEIGRGGFSLVYEAQDESADRIVAVKLLVPPPAAEKIAKERVKREIRAAQQLHHPSVVRIYELIEEGPWTFLVMEKVEGTDVQSSVSRNGPLSVEHVLRIGSQVAGALEEAHQRGILHRDIKPQNILIDSANNGRLTDFGSARIQGLSTLTLSGGLVGTIDFLPPELLSGRRNDPRSDLYSLGLVLYFCFCGELPPRESPLLPPVPSDSGFHPREKNNAVPSFLDEIIARATARDPSCRYPVARVFREALELTDRTDRSYITFPITKKSLCALCGGFNPLSSPICLACSQPSDVGHQVFLFLEKNETTVKHVTALALSNLAGARIDERAITDCVAGRRPVLAISENRTETVLTDLQMLGTSIGVYKAKELWRKLPLSFYILVVFVLAFGLSAGFYAKNVFYILTPLILAIIGAWAVRLVSNPILKFKSRTSNLSGALRKKLLETFSRMPSGTGRALLLDIVGLARSIFLLQTPAFVSGELRGAIEDLVSNSIDASLELGQLEEALDSLDKQKQKFSQFPDDLTEAYTRCEKARDVLAEKLLQGIASLGTVLGQAAAADNGAAIELEKSTNAIRAELEVQESVARKLTTLIQEVEM